MVQVLLVLNSLIPKENIMEFTKINPAEMFDATIVIDTIEKTTKSTVSMITDERTREAVDTMTTAGSAMCRAQQAAFSAYSDSIKTIFRV